MLVALAGGWYLLAPPSLGGRTTIVITHGTSMEPRFHTGDLVLLRARPSYAVGQIVGYRNDLLDRTVMHRIVAFANGHYSFKGDNNDFVDPDKPVTDQLVGSYWFSIPKVGLALAWAADRRHAPFVIGVAVLLLLGGGAGKAASRRRTRRPPVLVPAQWVTAAEHRPVAPVPPPLVPRAVPEPEPEPAAEPREPRHLVSPHLATPAAVTAACLALVAASTGFVAMAARGRPETNRTLVAGAYTVSGKFSYAARTAPSAVYPTGRIRTGDPVFVKLVPRVTFRFAYKLESMLPHGVRWRVGLNALVGSQQGWQRTLQLVAPHDVQGDGGTVSATVSLANVRRVVDRFQQLTGVLQPSYTLTLAPSVQVDGTVAGAPVKTTFAPQAGFSVDAYQLTVQQPQTLGNGPAPDPLSSSLAGSVDRVEPARMGLGLSAFSVATVRAKAPTVALGVALAALLTGLLALLARRNGRDGEDARIEREYGEWIVPISAGVVPSGGVIDVESFDSLVQIAEQYERMLLRQRVHGGFVYLVEESGTLYRYSTAKPGNTRTSRIPHPGDGRVPGPADIGHDRSDHAPGEHGELRRSRPISAL